MTLPGCVFHAFFVAHFCSGTINFEWALSPSKEAHVTHFGTGSGAVLLHAAIFTFSHATITENCFAFGVLLRINGTQTHIVHFIAILLRFVGRTTKCECGLKLCIHVSKLDQFRRNQTNFNHFVPLSIFKPASVEQS